MTVLSKKDSVAAALSVAEDIGSGKLSPADLEAQLVAEVTALFSVVADEGDPLRPVQIESARAVLAAGLISATELAEWSSVARHRESRAAGNKTSALDTPTPAAPDSSASEPLGPEGSVIE